MKYIIKGQEPAEFAEWKNFENEDWTPTFAILQGDEKRVLKDALMVEQGFICCYCERQINVNSCHIEHLKPQADDLFPENQLDYDNLLCSCQLDLEKGDPLHCGNSKGSWYDENLLVSPLLRNCESKFKYTFDGYIEPMNSNDFSAITTIDKLKLGIDKLNALRKKAIEPFIDEELTESDLNNFVFGYLVDKNQNQGKFNEFYTTIKYLFDN